MSYKPDPNAYAVDAFSLDWSKLQFYAFPPFCCISQYVQKIKTDKQEGILVTPHWPTQQFYSKIIKMKKGLPLIIPANSGKPCRSKRLEKFVDSSSKDRVDGLSCVRERFLIEGLSNESTNIIMES